MSVSIDYDKAKATLLRALKARAQPTLELTMMLKRVILCSHKTYRYVLVTNLLAKN